MENILVFAVLGLFAGAAARLFYPGRELKRVVCTMAVGVVGGLCGGMLSWIYWPSVDGEFQTGNLVVSMLGANIAIVFWASVAYVRSLNVPVNASP